MKITQPTLHRVPYKYWDEHLVSYQNIMMLLNLLLVPLAIAMQRFPRASEHVLPAEIANLQVLEEGQVLDFHSLFKDEVEFTKVNPRRP